jgi:hypothetical protein
VQGGSEERSKPERCFGGRGFHICTWQVGIKVVSIVDRRGCCCSRRGRRNEGRVGWRDNKETNRGRGGERGARREGEKARRRTVGHK